MSLENVDVLEIGVDGVDSAKLMKQYCDQKVTKQTCRNFVKAHGISNIEKDALNHIYNPNDPEFTYQLLTGAIKITNASKKKTMMDRHTKAAHDVYDELAAALSEKVEKVTKASLRDDAKKEGVQMISAKAIDAIYDAKDPIVTSAKWRAAIRMHKEKSISDSKTLTPVFAETANDLFDLYKNVFILEDEEEQADTMQIDE